MSIFSFGHFLPVCLRETNPQGTANEGDSPTISAQSVANTTPIDPPRIEVQVNGLTGASEARLIGISNWPTSRPFSKRCSRMTRPSFGWWKEIVTHLVIYCTIERRTYRGKRWMALILTGSICWEVVMD